MKKMSYIDAKIHATQDFICAIKNTSPDSPLVKLANSHKEAYISLKEIFRKTTSPAVLSRVPIEETYSEKILQMN